MQQVSAMNDCPAVSVTPSPISTMQSPPLRSPRQPSLEQCLLLSISEMLSSEEFLVFRIYSTS